MSLAPQSQIIYLLDLTISFLNHILPYIFDSKFSSHPLHYFQVCEFCSTQRLKQSPEQEVSPGQQNMYTTKDTIV